MQRIKMRLLAAVMCLVMAAPVTASANADDIERLNKIISELPAEEDITGEHADNVKEAMELYQSLTTAEKLEIDGFEKLEKGYDTPCREDLFSQGQWQLLSIARAVAADPEILLLDEITANLDAETELTVLHALSRAAANRTVLSISHRLYEEEGNREIRIS